MIAVPKNAIALPFTIARDDREGAPYLFSGLTADARHKYRPLIVPVKVVRLLTGDYSIIGMSNRVAVERKSLEDLYGTLAASDRRLRFQGEHERMQQINAAGGSACVVIEATMQDAMLSPPVRSNLSPKSVFRTFIAWTAKYSVPWHWCGDRQVAELVTLRTLEKTWYRLNRSQEGANHGRE